MNDQQLEKKVRQDSARVIKEVSTLVRDRAVQLSRLENNVSQATGKAKENFSVWVKDGITHVSKRLKKVADGAKETIADTAAAVNKNFSQPLGHQGSAKAQKAVEKAQDGLASKIARYPWVVISIGLAAGFVLGNLLKPARQPVAQF